jgi:20S proteasome alpha/beta subunit
MGVHDEVMLMLLFVLLIQLGSTAIGLKTKDGVVLAIEKRVTSPLLVLSHFLSGHSVK